MKEFKLQRMLALTAAALTATSLYASSGELNARWGREGRIAFHDDEHGEPVVHLTDANGECSVKLRGAHVTSCSFTGEKHPLLYIPITGYRAVPGERDFIHGGVPLLWPWFGSSGEPEDGTWRKWCRKFRLPVREEPPFHATGRYSLFSVKAVEAGKETTSVTLALGPCAEVSEYTPGDFALEYTIVLGAKSLGLRLKVTNHGEEIFRYREGYHPYFCVSDCYAVTLSGVDGCRYESSRDLPYDCDHVWRGAVPEWPGCDLFRFTEPKSVITLSDPAWKRDIVLKTTGAKDVVTWCQDVKGAAKGTMNILPEECRDYFCIEPSNFYPESEIALAKGESHVFETVIELKTR